MPFYPRPLVSTVHSGGLELVPSGMSPKFKASLGNKLVLSSNSQGSLWVPGREGRTRLPCPMHPVFPFPVGGTWHEHQVWLSSCDCVSPCLASGLFSPSTTSRCRSRCCSEKASSSTHTQSAVSRSQTRTPTELGETLVLTAYATTAKSQGIVGKSLPAHPSWTQRDWTKALRAGA